MSEKESTFIRQLKITLITVLGPFAILVIFSLINDHFNIKGNKEHIDAVESNMKNYVDNATLIIYIDEFRRANQAMAEALNAHGTMSMEEFNRVNLRIDAIVRASVPNNTRGEKPKL